MRTLEQWHDLARAVIRNVTVDNVTADSIGRIAWLCFEGEQSGGKVSVWHCSSIVHGHRCNCADCHPFQQ